MKRLILFSSNNCAPCQAIKSELLRLQQERGFDLLVHTLEENDAPFVRHAVRSVPMLVYANEEGEVDRHTGALSPAALATKLEGWGL
jgi:thiol-disulfide isomerase/thioredoxin